MGATLSQAGARHAVWDEHEKMLELIVSGRPDAAQQQALLHCDKASESLVARLGSVNDNDSEKTTHSSPDTNPGSSSSSASNSNSNLPSDNHQRRQA